MSNLSLIKMNTYFTFFERMTFRKSVSELILFVAFISFSGCASVKFYSDADLTKKTGLRYYTLKPYLLVEYKAEKDNTVVTSVVFLPDLANPQYVKVTSGLGSNNLDMTFENSGLTSYGLESSSEIPETMEAVAAMLSKSAYAAQTFRGEIVKEDEDRSEIDFKLYEIIQEPEGTKIKEIIPGK